jgi:hypothetical protein
MHHWKFGLLADAHGLLILAFPISGSVPYLFDSLIAGPLLVSKLVKPTKIFCSWPPYQGGFGQILTSETKTDIRTAAAGVLRETNPTVRQELSRLDSPDRIFDQLAEFAPLLVREENGQSFIAMKYLDDVTLNHRIAGRPLEIET